MSFKLDIVTPERKCFSDEVDMVIVRGAEGDLAILKGRSPLLTPLGIGKIRIIKGEKERVMTSVGGYVSVTKEATTIIADAAEFPEEIDVERAEEAKQRALRRISEKSRDIDIDRAELALKRAINRLNVVNYGRNLKD